MRVIWYLCLLLLGCLPLVAQPVAANHARVELIAERAAVTFHQRLWLGVHFQLEKDDVSSALEQAMGGKPIGEAATRPYGCSVKYKD